MKMSDKGLFQLASLEGLVVNPYYDTQKILTFGVGHTKSAGDPDPAKMTIVTSDYIEERILYALNLFKTDLVKYEDRVNSAVKVSITQEEFDALCSFDYNTGGITSASLVKSLNAKNKTRAATQFLNWSVPSSIIGRRKKEQLLFRDHTYTLDDIPIYNTKNMTYVCNKTAFRTLTFDNFMELYNNTSTSTDYSSYPVLVFGSKGDYVVKLQTQLNALKYDVGKADGIFGKNTQAQLRSFQSDNNLQVTGTTTSSTWRALYE